MKSPNRKKRKKDNISVSENTGRQNKLFANTLASVCEGDSSQPKLLPTQPQNKVFASSLASVAEGDSSQPNLHPTQPLSAITNSK